MQLRLEHLYQLFISAIQKDFGISDVNQIAFMTEEELERLLTNYQVIDPIERSFIRTKFRQDISKNQSEEEEMIDIGSELEVKINYKIKKR